MHFPRCHWLFSYPNVLVTAGLHDPRVGYWEPAKWVAKMRELKTDQHLLVFKCEMGAGHFSVTGRSVGAYGAQFQGRCTSAVVKLWLLGVQLQEYLED
jgi:hypothetical protein